MSSAAIKTTDTHKNNEPASQDAAKRRSISSSAVLEANVMELQHAAGNWAVWNSRLGSVPGTPRDGSVRSPGSVVQRQPIQSEGICPTCGRRGTGQCPECGQEFVPMQPGPPSSQTTKPSGLDTVRRVLNSG